MQEREYWQALPVEEFLELAEQLLVSQEDLCCVELIRVFDSGLKISYNRYPYPLLVLHWLIHVEYVSLKNIQIARDMMALI
jgi:hypothetical protein